MPNLEKTFCINSFPLITKNIASLLNEAKGFVPAPGIEPGPAG